MFKPGSELVSLSTPTRTISDISDAHVYGCVSYAEDPTNPVEVEFKTGIGGTQCMDNSGQSGNFTVTKGGVTCYFIGYVENKPYDTGLDNCVVRPSYWAVSYNTSMSQSGSTKSWWTANYHGRDYCYMELEESVAGTNICGSAALCPSTNYDWSYGTTPTFWVSRPFSYEDADTMKTLIRCQLIFQPEMNLEHVSLKEGKSSKHIEAVTATVINADGTSSRVGIDAHFDQVVLVGN